MQLILHHCSSPLPQILSVNCLAGYCYTDDRACARTTEQAAASTTTEAVSNPGQLASKEAMCKTLECERLRTSRAEPGSSACSSSSCQDVKPLHATGCWLRVRTSAHSACALLWRASMASRSGSAAPARARELSGAAVQRVEHFSRVCFVCAHSRTAGGNYVTSGRWQDKAAKPAAQASLTQNSDAISCRQAMSVLQEAAAQATSVERLSTRQDCARSPLALILPG